MDAVVDGMLGCGWMDVVDGWRVNENGWLGVVMKRGWWVMDHG